MKFTAVVENGFAKFEIYDCNFKKAVTIAKHLKKYVFEKAGIKLDDFVDVEWKPYLESLRKYSPHGDISVKDYWEADWSDEGEGKECPKYLAWLFELNDDCDGGFNYGYFGVNVSKTGYKVKEGFVPELPEDEE